MLSEHELLHLKEIAKHHAHSSGIGLSSVAIEDVSQDKTVQTFYRALSKVITELLTAEQTPEATTANDTRSKTEVNPEVEHSTSEPVDTPIEEIRLEATEGQMYHHVFTQPVIFDEALPEGFAFDEVSSTLSGKPAKSGVFHMVGRAQPGDQPVVVELRVSPDPKRMWKNLPSKQEAPHWKPDQDSEVLECGHRRLIAASVRGRSHAHIGSFRDDDFAIAYTDGWSVMVVADGGGSYSLARRGSQIAVSQARQKVLELLPQFSENLITLATRWVQDQDSETEGQIKSDLYHLLAQAAFDACRAIQVEASTSGLEFRQYYTTLALGLHRRTEVGDFVAGFWIGDSVIGAIDTQGSRAVLLGSIDSGEFSGEVRFLSPDEFKDSAKTFERIHFFVMPEMTALIGFTDGIVDPKFQTEHNLMQFERWGLLWQDLEPIVCEEAPLDPLVEWLGFWSKGDHDDRTIAILV